jgi:hypothetical protein
MDDKATVKIQRLFKKQDTVTEKNIYLMITKKQWKIVRIGGDPPW